jgi:hypothetical protein
MRGTRPGARGGGGGARTLEDISALLDLLGNSEGDVAVRGAAAWGVVTGGAAGDALCVDGAGPALEMAPVRRTYSFGAKMLTAGRYLRVNGDAGIGEYAALNQFSECVTPISGWLREVGVETVQADNTTNFKILDDGASIETLEMTGAVQVFTGISDLIAAGSELAVEYDAGTWPDCTTVHLLLGPNG